MAPIHELATEEMEQLLLFLAHQQRMLAVVVAQQITLAAAPQQEALVVLAVEEMELVLPLLQPQQAVPQTQVAVVVVEWFQTLMARQVVQELLYWYADHKVRHE
jgi:hypothetical protein